MKNYSPKFIGLAQALGLTAYIGFFALLVRQLSKIPDRMLPFTPALSIIMFLLAFVISALISGSLILGYPAVLFFDNKRKTALHIILWSAIWLIVIFGVITITTLSVMITR